LRPSRRDKIKAAVEENAKLRAAMETPMDREQWAKHTPQELRDQFAASALIAAELHPHRALRRLGFFIEDAAEREALIEEIFETPGVQSILSDDAKAFAGKKSVVMQRLYQIVRTEAPDLAVRAAGQLSKMIDGWQDGEKNKNAGQTLNFLMQMGTPAGVASVRNVTGAVAELPPGEEIIDAEAFFVDRSEEVVAVVDDPK
jgi:hypothetical protein